MTSDPLFRFAGALLLLASLVYGVLKLLVVWGGAPQPSFYAQTLILLTLSTAFIYRFLYRRREPMIFVQFYLLTLVVKLLAFGVYNGLMIWKDKPGAPANVVFFMAAYIAFTAFEIAFLYPRKSAR